MSRQSNEQSVNGTEKATEVTPKPKRRTFTAAYKLGILDEVERTTERGGIGAILRREGLYSSLLSNWRRQRELGELSSDLSKKRGRKSTKPSRELTALQRENERLRGQLEQAELIIAAQKKLAQALESSLNQDRDDES